VHSGLARLPHARRVLVLGGDGLAVREILRHPKIEITEPYHCYVPSFGEWGYTLAAHRPLTGELRLPADLRFLSAENFTRASSFRPTWRARPSR
jgi:predicted membrane-bound spermidine synthase